MAAVDASACLVDGEAFVVIDKPVRLDRGVDTESTAGLVPTKDEDVDVDVDVVGIDKDVEAMNAAMSLNCFLSF